MMIISKIQESCYTFVPNKPFGSLLKIFPKNNIFLKTFDSELQPLEIEGRINLTLIIK